MKALPSFSQLQWVSETTPKNGSGVRFPSPHFTKYLYDNILTPLPNDSCTFIYIAQISNKNRVEFSTFKILTLFTTRHLQHDSCIVQDNSQWTRQTICSTNDWRLARTIFRTQTVTFPWGIGKQPIPSALLALFFPFCFEWKVLL